MKCTVVIDPAREEEICIYAHERTPLVEELERLATEEKDPLIGYDRDHIAVPLNPADVCCFTVHGGTVTAHTDDRNFTVKQRLYQLEAVLPATFVKINQSCIANIRKIRKFDASLSGTLLVAFTCGYTDYVSRRNLKTVKERIGIKK